MKLNAQVADAVVLRELGERLARVRLERNLTQARLAEEAGVSKRTLERIEAGGPSQLVNLVRVFRALHLLDRFETLIPEPVISPVLQLKMHDKQRKRAKASSTVHSPKWEWNDKR